MIIELQWDFTTTGLLGVGSGWSISPGGLVLRFYVEDSLDGGCGGVNTNIQTGTATTTFSTTEPVRIDAIIDGMAEPFQTGRESITVTVDGGLIGYGESFQIQRNPPPTSCQAGPIRVLERPAFLVPGTHTIEVFVTTTDGSQHNGVGFSAELVFTSSKHA